ncbi:MAG: hypothetical protein ACOC32_04630 [Nanoarchaeota archaeon]
MQFDENGITLEKKLSELDKFTLDFLEILKKHTENYVLISSYVSILLGRPRGSENIDIIVEKMDKNQFDAFADDLEKNGFTYLNAKGDDMYTYLQEKTAIRFARTDEVIPNMKLKFPKRQIDEATLRIRIPVKINGKGIFISNLELQIAFKEEVLQSDKDIEDARHLREVAKDHLKQEKIESYKGMLNVE